MGLVFNKLRDFMNGRVWIAFRLDLTNNRAQQASAIYKNGHQAERANDMAQKIKQIHQGPDSLDQDAAVKVARGFLDLKVVAEVTDMQLFLPREGDTVDVGQHNVSSGEVSRVWFGAWPGLKRDDTVFRKALVVAMTADHLMEHESRKVINKSRNFNGDKKAFLEHFALMMGWVHQEKSNR